MQLLFLLIGRSWLVRLSGPLILTLEVVKIKLRFQDLFEVVSGTSA